MGCIPIRPRRFLERYQDTPWSRAMLEVPYGRAVDQTTLAPRRQVEDSPFHDEIILPQRIRNMAVIGMPLDQRHASGGISLSFGGAQASARSEQAQRLLEQVAPSLQRATSAMLRWQGLPPATAREDSLQLLPTAAMILAADARPLFANARAESLLSRGDALRVLRGRPLAAHPADVPRSGRAVARSRTGPHHADDPSLRRTAAARNDGRRQAAHQRRAAPLGTGPASRALPPGAAVLLLADLMA
ncbi:hypothetical protein [Pseudorhodoferax sp.]|uniref:hypothetical protein n=1 Tax=Pseudorhodoferax sp. TaxID=1993553 RepID=UPI0039E67C45